MIECQPAQSGEGWCRLDVKGSWPGHLLCSSLARLDLTDLPSWSGRIFTSSFVSQWIPLSTGTCFPDRGLLFFHQARWNGPQFRLSSLRKCKNRLQARAVLLEVIHQHHLEAQQKCKFRGSPQNGRIRILRDGTLQGLCAHRSLIGSGIAFIQQMLFKHLQTPIHSPNTRCTGLLAVP